MLMQYTLAKVESRCYQVVRSYGTHAARTSRLSSHSSRWIAPSVRKRHSVLQKRPIVNGKILPLHVSDLKHSCYQHQNGTDEKKNSQDGSCETSSRTYQSDLVVVLDMDECLIHSKFLGSGSRYAHQMLRKQTKPGLSNGGKSVDTFTITLPDRQHVLVHERPYLREFLKQVSSRYETHIFTAAMAVYAKPLLDTLDPNGEIFTNIWYRDSCTFKSTKPHAYVKDLGDLNDGSCNIGNRKQSSGTAIRLNRTVLVDNNPMSFLANPENGILVSSFYDDVHDKTLPAVVDLLDELDKHEDVRPVLDSRFQLRQAITELSSFDRDVNITDNRQQRLANQQGSSDSIAFATFA